MRRHRYILSDTNKEERREWMGARLISEEDSRKFLVESNGFYGNKTQML